MNPSGQAYLIDASMPFFRYYYAMPEHWFSREGWPTAAVYGYTHWLKRLLLDLRPDIIAACFDESLGSCFRNQIFPGYKASRPLPDASIRFQLTACKRITELMGVSAYASNVYEADDLIGTLARRQRRLGRRICIISRDKDLAQCLQAEDCLWHYPHEPPLSRAAVQQKWGVECHRLADYLALVGDPIDDIPGVSGIGPKTACVLLAHFDSLRELLANLDQIATLPLRGAAQLGEKIARHREQILCARQLATIDCRARLQRRARLKKRKAQMSELRHYARELGFSLDSLKDL